MYNLTQSQNVILTRHVQEKFRCQDLARQIAIIPVAAT